MTDSVIKKETCVRNFVFFFFTNLSNLQFSLADRLYGLGVRKKSMAGIVLHH